MGGLFGPETETVAVPLELPPGPVQVRVNAVTGSVSGPVEELPVVGRLPLHPPLAVHEVALVVVHEIVDALPAVTVEGLALIETTGGNAATTLTVVVAVVEPAGFVQASV
jgi:hypothetical protein